MKYLALLILFSMSACSSGKGTEKTTEIISETMYGKISRNGEYVTCKQKAFITCLSLSEETCLAEAKTLKPACLSYAVEKVPSYNHKEGMQNYFAEFVSCMSIKQALLHPKKTKGLMACLDHNGGINPDKMIESILKP